MDNKRKGFIEAIKDAYFYNTRRVINKYNNILWFSLMLPFIAVYTLGFIMPLISCASVHYTIKVFDGIGLD